MIVSPCATIEVGALVKMIGSSGMASLAEASKPLPWNSLACSW